MDPALLLEKQVGMVAKCAVFFQYRLAQKTPFLWIQPTEPCCIETRLLPCAPLKKMETFVSPKHSNLFIVWASCFACNFLILKSLYWLHVYICAQFKVLVLPSNFHDLGPTHLKDFFSVWTCVAMTSFPPVMQACKNCQCVVSAFTVAALTYGRACPRMSGSQLFFDH